MAAVGTTVVLAKCRANDFTVGVSDNLNTVSVAASLHVLNNRPGHEVNIIESTTKEQVCIIKDS